MYKLRGSLAAKVVSVVLLVVLTTGAVAAWAGTAVIWSGMALADSFYEDPLCTRIMTGAMTQILWEETEHGSADDLLLFRYAGLSYEIWDGNPETGTLVSSQWASQDNVHTQTLVSEYDRGNGETGHYTVVGYLSRDLAPYSGFAFYQGVYNLLHPLGASVTVIAAVLSLGAVAVLIFLLCAAGHRRGVEGVVPNWQDRLPLDLYLVGLTLLIFSACAVAMDASYGVAISPVGINYSAMVMFLLASLTMGLLALAGLMTMATRLKLGKWWRNSLCWRSVRWCRSLLRRFLDSLTNFTHILPMTWRTVLLVGGVLVGQIMLTLLAFDSYGSNGLFFLLLLAMDAALVMGAAWLSLQLQQIRRAGQDLAEGELETKIDTRKFYWDLKAHAENLNAIGQGLNRAVEQRMKSERLKTELITNVSHDIKTPLTSIVNYVDLLKKEELPETATEYLAVLDRQSRRLKKLTEDLVEASKASTGNVSVHLEPIVVNEIIHQAIGDYSEKLTAGKLEVIVNTYEGNLEAMADGRLLWRVLDNLLSNVCKYALAGTRVYVDLGNRDGRVVLSMKNISRDPLNVSADELMERFVRGDASRHTEGSGLGLNIARSLMDLMGGTFALSVDGDLFKAELSLSPVPPDALRPLSPQLPEV